MFGFLKRKQENPLRTILNGGSSPYADFVREVFLGVDNTTKAHVLVAYQNLIPIVDAFVSISRQKGTSFSIDDFIIECSENQKSSSDEVNSRRYAWFLFASLVYRLASMSERDAGLRETLADVWCDLARCAPLLRNLLPNNVVWKPEEKIWLSGVIKGPDPELVAWAINHGGPRVIWECSAIAKIAEEYGLIHLNDPGTLGPVTYIPPRSSFK